MCHSTFLQAFHAFLRMGKITNLMHKLQCSVVAYVKDGIILRVPDVILCGWLGSKHHLTNQESEPVNMLEAENNKLFVARRVDGPNCPLQVLEAYIRLWGTKPGSGNQSHEGNLWKNCSCFTLQQASQPIFNSHSFCIVAAMPCH